MVEEDFMSWKTTIENAYWSWGQSCLTSTENTHYHSERRTDTVPVIQRSGCPAQSHQRVPLKATDSAVGHQSMSIQFHWKYLSFLTECVFEVISQCHCILHFAVMTLITQLKKRKSINPVLLPWWYTMTLCISQSLLQYPTDWSCVWQLSELVIRLQCV